VAVRIADGRFLISILSTHADGTDAYARSRRSCSRIAGDLRLQIVEVLHQDKRAPYSLSQNGARFDEVTHCKAPAPADFKSKFFRVRAQCAR
jgi:hypothetical protein